MIFYKDYRNQIKTGDSVLFSSKGSPIGWIIQKHSKSPFNHAAGIIKIEEFKGLIDRLYLIEAKLRVTFARLSYRVENYNGSVYIGKLKQEFDPIRPYIASCILDDLGLPYDFKGLFGNMFCRVPMGGNFFCSELWWHGILGGIEKYKDEWGKLPTNAEKMVNESNEYLGNKAPRPGDIPYLSVIEGLYKIL